jgi:hypothetical protein
MTEKEVLRVLGNRITQAGSLRAFARKNGFSANFISRVVNEQQSVTKNLAEALGFERVIYFKPNIEITYGAVNEKTQT